MTPPTDTQIQHALRHTRGVLQPAADALGITRKALQTRITQSPPLQEALREARETLLDLAEQRLIAQIEEGNLRAIAFALKCHGKQRGYIERTELQAAPQAFIPAPERIRSIAHGE